MSCERHGKGTRSPAGARAAGSDCVASDAPGGGQGDREHAQTRLEGSRAEEGRLGWPAAGRGARARAIEGEAAGGGGGGDSGGDGGDDGGGSGGGGGRGGGGAAAAPSGPKIDTRCMHSFVWTEDSFVWTLWPSRTSFVWTSLLFFSQCFPKYKKHLKNLLCKGTQAMQATNPDSDFSNLYEGG